MFGRIVNRQRPVVVLFATHRVARERQSPFAKALQAEISFAAQSQRGGQARDLVKCPLDVL